MDLPILERFRTFSSIANGVSYFCLQVDGLNNIYHFKLNGREKLSVSRNFPYTAKSNRLSSETSVYKL